MLSRLFHTLRFLKVKQIRYQIYYRIKRKMFKTKYIPGLYAKGQMLDFQEWIPKRVNYFNASTFDFLNCKKDFEHISNINWDFEGHGKLWAYNLNYMDYLLMPNLTPTEGNRLLNHFIDQLPQLNNAIEPYPISLRGINWIKYSSGNRLSDDLKLKFDVSLYGQYHILYNNLEYHLLGNHLLENGISLLFGAYYFKHVKWYNKARAILKQELAEQILPDGGHFELSPMYHEILLDRLLDAYNLLENNVVFEGQYILKEEVKNKCQLMIGWINQVCFSLGNIPLFNDAAFSIAPEKEELNGYAKRLKLSEKREKLSFSGIRAYNFPSYELRYDAGNIGPVYIPGHAHSDTFGFELYVKGNPVIVDTGTSTYQKDGRRQIERQTEAHNTVKYLKYEQSDVWGGHKVGRRAKVTLVNESDHGIEASHDGYSVWGVAHTRVLSCHENIISIRDNLSGNKSQGTAYLHFHPDQKVSVVDGKLVLKDVSIGFENCMNLELKAYEYAPEFNKRKAGKVAEITFVSNLITKIGF